MRTLNQARGSRCKLVGSRSLSILSEVGPAPISSCILSESCGETNRILYAHHNEFTSIFHRQHRVLAAAALVTLSPLMVLIYFVIKLTSKGPAIYRQTRVGLNQKSFEIAKFRSMVVNAESGKAVWCSKNDSRVTRVGRVLRRLHRRRGEQVDH